MNRHLAFKINRIYYDDKFKIDAKKFSFFKQSDS